MGNALSCFQWGLTSTLLASRAPGLTFALLIPAAPTVVTNTARGGEPVGFPHCGSFHRLLAINDSPLSGIG
jgi:hypothetical protein